MKNRNRLLRELSFFTLFSSLIFGGAQYVECQNLYPDEILDLFGTPNNSGGSLTISKCHPSVYWFFNLLGITHSVQCHELGDLYLEGFGSELVLSATLRC